MIAAYWQEDADPPNIALGSESSHYLFMVFTYISNHNIFIRIFIYLPPIVSNDSEANLSNCVINLNINVQYIARRLHDTNQFAANCGLRQQSPLSLCFYKDMIYFQDFQNCEEPR